MDLNRLSRGEQIVGGAGILLLLLSFFPLWAKYEVGDFGLGVGAGAQRGNAWSGAFNFLPKLGLFLVILAVVLVILRLAATDLRLPFQAGLAYVILSGVATLLLLIPVLTGPEGAEFSGLGLEVSRGPLLLIGWLLAAAMTYGGYLHMQEEGTTVAPRSPLAPPSGPGAPPPPAS